MALLMVWSECNARTQHVVSLPLRGSKCGMKVMPCCSSSGRSWPSHTRCLSSHTVLLQTSVVMVQLGLSVVFFPYSLSFPVRPLNPLGGALPATVVWQWNQAELLMDQPVRSVRKSNSIMASLYPLEILVGRNPLPAVSRMTSQVSLQYQGCMQLRMQGFGHM